MVAADAAAGEPDPVTVLGIDETRRGKPRWTLDATTNRWVRTDAWDTGFIDLGGVQGLLGQVEGRTSAAVVTWLKARSPAFRAGILFVAIDPAAVYAKAIRTVLEDGTLLLPNATLVVDHFHLVKLANDAVTAVRRRVIWEQKGRPCTHRGPQDRPGLGQPPTAADRPGSPIEQRLRHDVEHIDRLRTHRPGAHRLDR